MTHEAERYHGGKRIWSAEEDQVLRRAYPDTPTAALATRLRRTVGATQQRARVLGVRKSAAYLATLTVVHLTSRSIAARFQKGHVPANKGLRRPGYAPGRMRETQFKRGERRGRAADHHMPIGSTRLIEGYVYRKVSDRLNVPYTVNWKAEHVLVWRRARRKIPPGHCLAFKNGNPLDVRLENLECVSRRALMARNTVHNLPKPLAQAVQLLGALHRQIRRRSHGAQQDRGLA